MSCKWFDVCPLRELERSGKIRNKWRNEYCLSKENWANCRRYQLEERGIPHENILPDGGTLK
jgi:hypothetical protein